MGIFYFILLLSVIVLIHELGHLISAKYFKVYCYEFALGMGPKIFSIKGKETVYSLRLLPIGGFVAMAGEDDKDRGIEVPFERTIKGIDKWKQIIVMLAGVFMNFVLAWFLFGVILLDRGFYYESSKPIIDGIIENSPADKAGLMVNDYILKVTLSDKTTIVPKKFEDILPFTHANKDELVYTIKRGEEVFDVKITPYFDEKNQGYIVGIKVPKGKEIPVNLINAPYYAAKQLVNVTKSMFVALIRLFKGKSLDQLSGPIGVYAVASKQASLGFANFLMLIAIFSLNVGIFNLLPMPVLDGGRALIVLGEMITKKSINQKLELALMLAGWLVMISLMLFTTWQDINKLF